MMLRTRIVAFVVLALILAAFAVYTSPTSAAYAWASGKCFRASAPPACHFTGRR